MSTRKVLIKIYKSPKKPDYYLYVPLQGDLERVPEALLAGLKPLQTVTTMALTAERKLARYTGEQILTELDEKGFFLQLPPVDQEDLTALWPKKKALDSDADSSQ